MTRLLAIVLATLALPASPAAAAPVTVLAAASLTDVFPRVDKGARYSFAGSDQLALQLRQGAPATSMPPASPKYAELLYRDGFVFKPVVFATNRLVVLVPGRIRVGSVRCTTFAAAAEDRDRGSHGADRRLHAADSRHARHLGRRPENVVTEETDVKGIVAKVALGEADAGFVYSTDAKPVASRTRVVTLPAWAQPSIRYEVAVVRATARLQAARAFVQKLLSPRGDARCSRPPGSGS